MRFHFHIIFLVFCFSCKESVLPVANLEAGKSPTFYCSDINEILDNYTITSDTDWIHRALDDESPLIKLKSQPVNVIKKDLKKIRLKTYEYAKRFDEDIYDLISDRTFLFDKKNRLTKIYGLKYFKEISYSKLKNKDFMISFIADSSYYNKNISNSAIGLDLEWEVKETKNNNEVDIIKKRSYSQGRSYKWEYLRSANYKKEKDRILNRDTSYYNVISKTRLFKDTLNNLTKKIILADKIRGGIHGIPGLFSKGSHYEPDSVLFKYENINSYGARSIKKYTDNGSKTHESRISYSNANKMISVTNSTGQLRELFDPFLPIFSVLKIYLDNNCNVVKAESVSADGENIKLNFNEYGDIVSRISFRITKKMQNKSGFSYDEKYEELLLEDYDLMKLSEYSITNYYDYEYDNFGNYTARKFKKNYTGYPGSAPEIKVERQIEYK
tara:strand:- start:711 stop:2033 length:1323 start_codon:yes stop_codon:yes gene_type:complete